MIAICPNPFRDLDLALTRKCKAMLEEAGFETAICPVFSDDEPEARSFCIWSYASFICFIFSSASS